MNEKKPTIKNYFRLISSLLFYSSVYFLSINLLNKHSPSLFPIQSGYDIKYPLSTYLWFFYSIFLIYFFCSLVKIKSDFKITLTISIIIFTLCNANSSTVVSALLGINFKNFLSIDNEYVFYVLYAITGGSFYNYKSVNWKLPIIITTISLGFIALLTTKSTIQEKHFVINYFVYQSIFVFVAATGFFAFLCAISERLPDNKIIQTISSYSLCIYGYHWILIYIAQRVFSYHKYSSFYTIPITLVLVLITSSLLAMLTKKLDRRGFVS